MLCDSISAVNPGLYGSASTSITVCPASSVAMASWKDIVVLPSLSEVLVTAIVGIGSSAANLSIVRRKRNDSSKAWRDRPDRVRFGTRVRTASPMASRRSSRLLRGSSTRSAKAPAMPIRRPAMTPAASESLTRGERGSSARSPGSPPAALGPARFEAPPTRRAAGRAAASQDCRLSEADCR